MKKLLAILLAIAMLCAFAGIGASALTPEEAAAWALVEGTRNTYESGTFTTSTGSLTFAMDGARMATERLAYFSRIHGGVFNSRTAILRDRCRQAIAEILLGKRRRLVTTPEGNFISFPGRRVYAQVDPAIQVGTKEPDELRALWPDHIPDSFALRAVPGNDRVEARLKWENAGPVPVGINYTITDGQVSWFEYGIFWASGEWYGERGFSTTGLSPRADASWFSTAGMLKLPWWLMKALLSLAGTDYNHRVWSFDLNPIAYKPVIYLYPQQPTEVNVTLQMRDARLIESIPDYGAGWNVLARPDGTLTNLADGEEYPYLFWEAAFETPWPRPKEGFVVARADLAGFLGEKLAYLGLNDAEAGEFMEFWLPVLARNEYSLIHFAEQDYTGRFPLNILPAPDSLLRVFMVAGATEQGERVPAQTLVPFERKGFAVVEWGGTML